MQECSSLGPVLGRCAHLARERMDARLTQYDVTPAQTHVMMYLSHHNWESPQGALTQYLRVKPSTVNGIVDRMVERGLASRTVRSTDARQRVIALTDMGRRQLAVFERSFQAAEAVLSAGFSTEELETLHAMLSRIIHNLEEDRNQC